MSVLMMHWKGVKPKGNMDQLARIHCWLTRGIKQLSFMPQGAESLMCFAV